MRRPLRVATALLATLVAGASVRAQLEVRFAHKLSNFSGVLPYSDVQIHADRFHDEVYVGLGDSVRVFNAAGMEIYDFTHDAMRSGSILDLAVEESGDILILSYRMATEARPGGPQISRYDYRGEPKDVFEIKNLPDSLHAFTPNRMFLRGGKLVLASSFEFLLVTAELSGTYLAQEDLQKGLEPEERSKGTGEIGGIDVDEDGTVYYTVPSAFRAYRRSPDGTIRSWGKAGSAPGSFGVTGAILSDDHGNVFVADRARGVVLAFDRNLNFVREFGSRGTRDERLSRPGALALGNAGRLYVTQLGYRGIAVFTAGPPAEATGP